jgi:hypothetical protein
MRRVLEGNAPSMPACLSRPPHEPAAPTPWSPSVAHSNATLFLPTNWAVENAIASTAPEVHSSSSEALLRSLRESALSKVRGGGAPRGGHSPGLRIPANAVHQHVCHSRSWCLC